MKFCTTEEFGTLSPTLLSELAAGEEVVVTKNGRPVALMIGVEDGRLEEALRAVRREVLPNFAATGGSARLLLPDGD